jgi:Family of unknown function (DUF5677)
MRTKFEFAHHALDTTLEAARLLRWVTEVQQCALALHGTTIELFAGCLALADTERAAAIPIVMRSLYEAAVDLENLLLNAEYLKNMEAANLAQIHELLVQGRVNPLFRGLDQGSDTTANLRQFGNRLAELKRLGRGVLSIKDRCAAVNRDDEYRTVYALLTLDVHNNLAALGDRHFEDAGENGTIAIFGEGTGKSTESRLSLAMGYFLQSAAMIHHAFRTGDTSVLHLLQEFDRTRSPVGAAGGS